MGISESLFLKKIHFLKGDFTVHAEIQTDSLVSLYVRSSIGGVAYVTVFNSSATWAATFRLQGYNYKCMLVIFAFP